MRMDAHGWRWMRMDAHGCQDEHERVGAVRETLYGRISASRSTRPRVEQVLVLSSLLLTLLIAGLFTNVLASSLRPWIAGTRAQGWIGPLSTQGGELVDITGQEVHLAGVNWFGFETASF